MIETFLDVAASYGLPGCMLLAMGWFIVKMYNDHRIDRESFFKAAKEERDETKVVLTKLSDSVDNLNLTTGGLNQIVTAFLQDVYKRGVRDSN